MTVEAMPFVAENTMVAVSAVQGTVRAGLPSRSTRRRRVRRRGRSPVPRRRIGGPGTCWRSCAPRRQSVDRRRHEHRAAALTRRLPTTSRVMLIESTVTTLQRTWNLPIRYRASSSICCAAIAGVNSPVQHLALHIDAGFADRGIGQHPVQHGVPNHLPGPVDLLGSPPCLEFPCVGEHLAVPLRRCPTTRPARCLPMRSW